MLRILRILRVLRMLRILRVLRMLRILRIRMQIRSTSERISLVLPTETLRRPCSTCGWITCCAI